ncbi:hypothetical protein [Janthinobacterium sp.]|uniref:hypothetical protein n=1 Tax=Janthinobacterium sp. TaxID=1871054 RepID=UPI00258AD36C|nr:hypothetical protein [Janthinobacterium sp.]MCX7290341.1 hypothetical protein [Janthinobacterium sp.]
MPITYTALSDHAVSTGIPPAPWRLLMGGTVLLLLSACANLHTINRTTELPLNGKAIHLDAPQRLVYADALGHTCAEPTPDALQAYISAAGAGVNSGQNAASISTALSANATSVGLHSQSITLMREHLFRICEYAQNKSINAADTMLLMERSQDLTMGVLAIEQLTGAVVARQTALTGQGQSAASAGVLATQAQLDKAEERLAEREGDLDDVRDARIAQASASEQAQQALLDAAKADPKKTAAEIKTLQDAASSAQLKLSQLDARLAAAQQAVDKAESERDALDKKLNAAVADSNASTAGTAQFSGGRGRSNVSPATARHLARASVDIVKAVLEKGHMTDNCINFMSVVREQQPVRNDAPFQAMTKLCTQVFEAAIKKNQENPDQRTLMMTQ